MSDTCSLFPPFGDPWPSRLLPSHHMQSQRQKSFMLTSEVWMMPECVRDFFFFFKQNVLTGISQARLLCSWNSPGKNTEVSCCCSVTQSCPTLCYPMDCRTPGFPFTISWSLLKLMSIELMMPSDHLLLCRSLLLLPSIFPSIRVLPNEMALCIR